MRKASLGIVLAAVAGLSAFEVNAVWAAPTRQLGVYEEFATANCAMGAGCIVYFSEVLKPLKITKVSCNFVINNQNASLTGAVLGAATAAKTQFKGAQYLATVETLDFAPTFEQYQVLADTLHVVAAKYRPAIQIGFNVQATSTMNCSIAGSET